MYLSSFIFHPTPQLFGEILVPTTVLSQVTLSGSQRPICNQFLKPNGVTTGLSYIWILHNRTFTGLSISERSLVLCSIIFSAISDKWLLKWNRNRKTAVLRPYHLRKWYKRSRVTNSWQSIERTWARNSGGIAHFNATLFLTKKLEGMLLCHMML